MKFEIGSLVTWKVDNEDFVLKSKVKNLDLEIGLILNRSGDKDHDVVHDQIELIYVFWFNREQKFAWVPINNLSNISGR